MFLFVTRRHQMTRGNEIRVFALCFIKTALEQSKILFLRFRHEHFCLFVFKLYYSYPIKSPVATTDGRCNHHTNRQRINHHLGSFLYDRRYNAYCNTRYENQKPVSLSYSEKIDTFPKPSTLLFCTNYRCTVLNKSNKLYNKSTWVTRLTPIEQRLHGVGQYTDYVDIRQIIAALCTPLV